MRYWQAIFIAITAACLVELQGQVPELWKQMLGIALLSLLAWPIWLLCDKLDARGRRG